MMSQLLTSALLYYVSYMRVGYQNTVITPVQGVLLSAVCDLALNTE
jgi:hypothetical protein